MPERAERRTPRFRGLLTERGEERSWSVASALQQPVVLQQWRSGGQGRLRSGDRSAVILRSGARCSSVVQCGAIRNEVEVYFGGNFFSCELW